MRKYYVHYVVSPRQAMRMIMPVMATSESNAIEICKAERAGSFGHWIQDPERGASCNSTVAVV